MFWSDTQVIAAVEEGSASGNAMILQNGVMSNPVPFTVTTAPQIANITPTSGAAGTAVTITGTGFGAAPGMVVIGSATANEISSWSATQIVALVPSGSLSGVVKVFQNGYWSNAVTFTVPGGSVTLVPNVINMMVGDTHAIQALNSAGQSVTGLTWSSSNTNVVTLSTDDPPVLTAVGVGRSTITAGGASADVTVSPVLSTGLPLGTVLCSNPGDGSGVTSIVPAVPSQTGVADVFALQNDGTVAAINSDCTTAWTAPVNGTFIPDFQGGLAVLNNGAGTITKFDGITGQPYPSYTAASPQILTGQMVAGTDGTIYAVEFNPGNVGQGGAGLQTSLVGINPLTGAQLFSIPLEPQPAFQEGYFPSSSTQNPTFYIRAQVSNLIVAGDGYAYLAFDYPEIVLNSALSDSPDTRTEHVMLLRVNSAGEFDKIPITNVPGLGPEGMLPDGSEFGGTLITNADTGVLLSWGLSWDAGCAFVRKPANGMALTNGTSVTLLNQPQVPICGNGGVRPVLQAQDGSFVGTYNTSSGTNMVAFDTSGNIRWTVPNEQPQIATDDGGVIGQSGIAYDANGNAVGQIGTATQSWFGHTYQIGSVERIFAPVLSVAQTLWAIVGGNPSGNGTAPSTSPTLLSAMVIPNLPGVLEGQRYMPGVITEAQRVLNLYQDCAEVFGNAQSRKGAFNPSVVLSAVFGNIDPRITEPLAVPNKVAGRPVGSVFIWPSILPADGLTFPSLYVSTDGIATGPRVAISLTAWNSQGENPNPGLYNMAVFLLHEMGHVYNLLKPQGSGGSKITQGDLLETAYNTNTARVVAACYPNGFPN
jgi:hypothetical protein